MTPISILPQEVVILSKIAEELDLNVHFRHGYIVYDSINDIEISLSYIMELNNGRCPFLKDNKCSIHYIYKPYICRSFPYVPRHVKYNIDSVNKYIKATTDYGLSFACHIIREDYKILEKYPPNILLYYMKNEYAAAMEAENIRNYMLSLLSISWREGLVDIKNNRRRTIVVNLYEFLRKYYPNLPNMIGIDKVSLRMRRWLEDY